MVAHIVTSVLQSEAPCGETVLDFMRFTNARAEAAGVHGQDVKRVVFMMTCDGGFQMVGQLVVSSSGLSNCKF